MSAADGDMAALDRETVAQIVAKAVDDEQTYAGVEHARRVGYRGRLSIGRLAADRLAEQLAVAAATAAPALEVEWGVLGDEFTPKPSREAAERTVERLRTGKYPIPDRHVAWRYVSTPRRQA